MLLSPLCFRLEWDDGHLPTDCVYYRVSPMRNSQQSRRPHTADNMKDPLKVLSTLGDEEAALLPQRCPEGGPRCHQLQRSHQQLGSAFFAGLQSAWQLCPACMLICTLTCIIRINLLLLWLYLTLHVVLTISVVYSSYRKGVPLVAACSHIMQQLRNNWGLH